MYKYFCCAWLPCGTFKTHEIQVHTLAFTEGLALSSFDQTHIYKGKQNRALLTTPPLAQVLRVAGI